MTSILQRLLFRRKPVLITQLSAEQESELEVLISRGELSAANILSVARRLARSGHHEQLKSIVERAYSAGLRDKALLTFAVDLALARRDYTSALRYAEALRFYLGLGGDALYRLALVNSLRGSYAPAVALFHELLREVPGHAAGRFQLGKCLLRQGAIAPALECLEQARALSHGDAEWLRGLQTGPRKRTNWLGKERKATLNIRVWRTNVLKAPLQVQTRNLEDVDLWLNTCQYITDERLTGTPEHWQTPDQIERGKVGDCEDFALWAWVQLLRQGVNARFVIGGLYADGINHAWVQIYGRRSVGVLECVPAGYNPVIPARNAIEYTPLISFDKNLREYRH